MAWHYMNEIGRKIIHLMILIVLVVFFIIQNVWSQKIALLGLVGLLIMFLVHEYCRLELGLKLPFISSFIRPKEHYRMFGAIYFLAAATICLAVFDMPIAIAALLMITFGDLAAAIAGTRFGTTVLFKNKTTLGFAAELITNLIVAVAVSLFFSFNIYIPITMAFVATIIETVVDELDDNLVVPIICGFVGQLLLFSL